MITEFFDTVNAMTLMKTHSMPGEIKMQLKHPFPEIVVTTKIDDPVFQNCSN